MSETIRRVGAIRGVRIEEVAVAATSERPSLRARLLTLYGRLDRRLLALPPDPDVPAPLEPHHAPTEGPAGSSARADLLLDLACTTAPPAPGRASEVWRVVVGAHAAACVEPYFWSLYRSQLVCAVSLEATLPDGSRRVVDRSYSAVDLASIARTRDPVLWKSSEMLARSVRRFARGGTQTTIDETEATDTTAVRESGPPRAIQLAWWCARVVARVVRRRTEKALGHDEWFLAVRPVVALPEQSARAAETLLRGRSFRRLANPPGVFRADPFLLERGDRHYLFFEEYVFAEAKGHIAVAEIDEYGFVSPPLPCLTRDYHLSYPFVFEHEGQILMVPESEAHETIDLYRSTKFPDEWELERTLMSGFPAVDATLFRDDEVWWLFANVFVRGASASDELYLFSAGSLDGAWTPHPQNPIVSDIRSARPAGPLFRIGGDLIRPAQDGSRSYGSRICLRRVLALTPSEYREEPAGIVSPSWLPRAHATHTYGRSRRLEVTDGRRYALGGQVVPRR